jgi:hypothetical protein
MLRLEAIDTRDGKVKMTADQGAGVYPMDVLLHMQRHGYVFLLDGKPWNPRKKPRVDYSADNMQLSLID